MEIIVIDDDMPTVDVILSELNFEKFGVAVTPFPAGYRTNAEPRRFHYMWLAPSAGALEDSVCVMREELRCFVTKMTGF